MQRSLFHLAIQSQKKLFDNLFLRISSRTTRLHSQQPFLQVDNLQIEKNKSTWHCFVMFTAVKHDLATKKIPKHIKLKHLYIKITNKNATTQHCFSL